MKQTSQTGRFSFGGAIISHRLLDHRFDVNQREEILHGKCESAVALLPIRNMSFNFERYELLKQILAAHKIYILLQKHKNLGRGVLVNNTIGLHKVEWLGAM